jgi:ATP-dependent Clp protease ATP-binding subunit ClpC
MEAALSAALPDQQEVIVRASRSIRKSIAFFGGEGRPLGAFLALGPVEPVMCLARSLAGFLYGSESAVLCLDLSEFAEKWQISRLIGHSGGLVCAYVEGELTEPVWRQPRTVVVLGNFEKMNAGAWPLFTEILEDGVFIDGLGRTVSFAQSLVFLTTMAGHGEAIGTPMFVTDAEGQVRPAPLPSETRRAVEQVIPADLLKKIHEVLPFRG